MAKSIEIVHTNDKATADALVAQGYEAVECSFGSNGGVVGPLTMDHHGSFSHLEGVALRAYRDNFGARRDDPRFVVTGAADADACFCIASLCGILPHPSRTAEFEKAPPPVKASNTKDITSLAELVNKVDTAPIGVRLEESEEGAVLLLWNQMSSSSQDATAFHAGVDRWRCLLGRAPKALLAAAKQEEAGRVTEARKAEVIKISDQVAVVESTAWGFDVWYAEVAPVIIAYVVANGNITVGAPSDEVAEKLLGFGDGCGSCYELQPGMVGQPCKNGCVDQKTKDPILVGRLVGLQMFFSSLQPKGWGGRAAIGGSPRGAKLTREQALEAARVIDAGIIR